MTPTSTNMMILLLMLMLMLLLMMEGIHMVVIEVLKVVMVAMRHSGDLRGRQRVQPSTPSNGVLIGKKQRRDE